MSSISYGVIACLLLRLDKAGDQWQDISDLCVALQLPIDNARHHLEQLFVDGIVSVKRHPITGEIEAAKSALVDDVPEGQITSGVIVDLLLRLEPAGAVWTAVAALCDPLKLSIDQARLHLEQMYVDGIVRVTRNETTGEIESAMFALSSEERPCA